MTALDLKGNIKIFRHDLVNLSTTDCKAKNTEFRTIPRPQPPTCTYFTVDFSLQNTEKHIQDFVFVNQVFCCTMYNGVIALQFTFELSQLYINCSGYFQKSIQSISYMNSKYVVTGGYVPQFAVPRDKYAFHAQQISRKMLNVEVNKFALY